MTAVHPQTAALVRLAREKVGTWVDVKHHQWASLYCWQPTTIFDAFGEPVGKLEADTIYIDACSPCPEQDLFHELGHAVARRFDLIGHRGNGFIGPWEQRQRRLIGGILHRRHWSRLLEEVRQSSPPYTPELCSEIWAELFMCWHLYPERCEIAFIRKEMDRLAVQPELRSVALLSRQIMAANTTARLP